MYLPNHCVDLETIKETMQSQKQLIAVCSNNLEVYSLCRSIEKMFDEFC